EAGSEAPDLAERKRQEVEEERPLGLRRERDHLALRLGVGLGVDVLEVGRLSAQTRTVVHDLAVDLARAVVDEGHQSLNRLSMSSSVISLKIEGAWCVCAFLLTISKTRPSSSAAFFTRSRTSPSDERSSNKTTRMARWCTSEMWMCVFSPS